MRNAAAARKDAMIAGNLDTSFLKILALLFMLCDHIGAALFPSVIELRVIGRMAFPLYAWCLVVGSVKTRSPMRYGIRLLLLAAVSQPLYMMALNHGWEDLNILFALLIALIAIRGIQVSRLGSQIWVPALCYVLLGFVQVDYGWKGLTFIILLYLAKGNRRGLVACYLAYALFWGTTSLTVQQLFGVPLAFLKWPGIGVMFSSFFRLQSMVWLSLPLIAGRTSVRPRISKWMGYALYPMHLLLLIALKLLGGYTFEMLLLGF